ncbi:iron-sulfur cluster assembly accessory protein [Priestia megaterium]|nr:iron-sulfur cluster assembly accessory protein [Priestia megaterium]
MKVKINRNAAKVFNNALNSPEGQGKMIRVYVTVDHGDHAQYDWKFDTPNEHDEIVHSDKEIAILLDKCDPFLEAIWIQYFHVPEPEFVISSLNHSHHH